MAKVFKTPVTLDILYDLLDQICLVKEKCYIFDVSSLNKMVFLGLYEPFLQRLREYYLPSKYGYLTKEASVASFMSIVKQICKYHELSVTTNPNERMVYYIQHK
jgi:hypothetical protein